MIHEGVDHLTDRNYIHWDITTICNYKCSYCYAMREYGDSWNKEVDISTIDSILNAINLSTLPVFLGLLGGEPTYSKHFGYILEWLKNNFFKREQDRVYITTNNSRSLSWFQENIPPAKYFNDKLFFLLSWHAKEANSADFFKNLEYLLELGYKVKVNVMIDPDPSTWNNTRELLNQTKSYNINNSDSKLIVHPHFVYKNEHQLYDYPDNLKDYFSEIVSTIPKEFKRNEILYNDLEIFTLGLNNFKDWNCHLNNYEINLFGTVSKFCVNETSNLIQDPLFFRRIKKTVPVICPHKACTCDGLLKVRKTTKE